MPSEKPEQRSPTAIRETDHYKQEYVEAFVDKWDELIDWEARTAGEGKFFADLLRQRGVQRVLDVATGTGFHSVSLKKASLISTVRNMIAQPQLPTKLWMADSSQNSGFENTVKMP